MKLADEVGVSLPATSIAREMLRAAKIAGQGRSGFLRRHDRDRGHGRYDRCIPTRLMVS